MVLPMESWWLLRNVNLRSLPLKAPVFWPTSFGFFSAGRRWLWECEPEVPVIGVERLRQLIEGAALYLGRNSLDDHILEHNGFT